MKLRSATVDGNQIVERWEEQDETIRVYLNDIPQTESYRAILQRLEKESVEEVSR